MSGTAVQKMIYNAYKSVARQIGFDYRVFRPIVYTNSSTSPEDYVGTFKCTVSQDVNYAKAVGYNLQLWETYINGNNIQQGDILWRVDDDRYLMVVSMQENLPILSIETPNTATIIRSTYDDFGDGFEAGSTEVAVDLRCNIQPRSPGTDAGLADQMDPGIGESWWTVYLWMPKGSIENGDIIIDELGNRMEVRFSFYTHMGYKLACQELKS